MVQQSRSKLQQLADRLREIFKSAGAKTSAAVGKAGRDMKAGIKKLTGDNKESHHQAVEAKTEPQKTDVKAASTPHPLAFIMEGGEFQAQPRVTPALSIGDISQPSQHDTAA
jgi:hypothetical protein